MSFLTVNPDSSIQDVTEADENSTGIEVDNSELDDIKIHPIGHSFFDYIDNEIVLSQSREDARLFDKAQAAKIIDLKNEAIVRMREQVAVSNFDEVELTREFWLSIDPAARAPTTGFQWVIDVYQAGRDASVIIKALTDAASVAAYDVQTDPAWPE